MDSFQLGFLPVYLQNWCTDASGGLCNVNNQVSQEIGSVAVGCCGKDTPPEKITDLVWNLWTLQVQGARVAERTAQPSAAGARCSHSATEATLSHQGAAGAIHHTAHSPAFVLLDPEYLVVLIVARSETESLQEYSLVFCF